MLRKLEKYDVLEEIGHGGMATVYRARDERLDREVAIKVLHPHLRGASEARSRFEREARSVARLRHPNILEIYDYSGESSDESYIAAELLTGPTLKHYGEAHPDIPAEIAACFAIEIARALGAAHARGIVHRDVKPENVLLHENRCIKLTDFGIAHMLGGQSFTATGQILGSPGHMAPEQVEGKDCDARSDLFSLGTVLYYLAAGRLPFAGTNPHQVLKRIMDGDYADPLRVRPAMGAPLAAIVRKLLERDPDARFATAEEVERELTAFVAAIGIDDPSRALAEYLVDPEGCAERLRARTIVALTERGEQAMARGEVRPALDDFNRVLALDEGNERVLGHIDRIRRRGDRRRLALLVAGVTLGLSGTLGLGLALQGQLGGSPASGAAPGQEAGEAEPPSSEDITIDTNQATPVPTGIAADPSTPGAPGSIAAPTGPNPSSSVTPAPASSAPQSHARTPRHVVFRPTPQNVLIGIDGAEPRPFGPSFHETKLEPGRHRFVFQSGGDCCLDAEFVMSIPPGPGTTVVARKLPLRPAGLYVRSNVPAAVKVGEGRAQGRAREVLRIPMDGDLEEVVRLTVTAPGQGVYTGAVRLRAGRVAEVDVQLEPTEGAP
jgi:eukaryotic-like serine/threonine-protein kinase